jgi:hypothetical protein
LYKHEKEDEFRRDNIHGGIFLEDGIVGKIFQELQEGRVENDHRRRVQFQA